MYLSCPLFCNPEQSDPDDPNGPDLDIKIEELKENIRKAETEKVKAESVIECFQDGGVNVEEWMKDVESLSTGLELPRSGSSASLKTDGSLGVGQLLRLSMIHYNSGNGGSVLIHSIQILKYRFQRIYSTFLMRRLNHFNSLILG